MYSHFKIFGFAAKDLSTASKHFACFLSSSCKSKAKQFKEIFNFYTFDL